MDNTTGMITGTITDTITQTATNNSTIRRILAIFLILLTCFWILKYNKLIRLLNLVKNALADIEAQMQMRFDLVWNLIAVVQNYSSYEKEALTKVIQARSNFLQAKNEWEKFEADTQLDSVLQSLFAVSEKYPELKSNQNYAQLQEDLIDIDNKIAAARRFYNSSVKDYNTARESFPTNIIAKLFKAKFKEQEFFEVSDKKARKAVNVTIVK